MPKFSSYVKRDGSVEPAYNLNKWSATEAGSDPSAGAKGYKEFVLKIRSEQPMLYNTLISDQGVTNANITNAGTLQTYIQKNTFDLTNGATPIALLEEASEGKTKAKLFSKSK